jgi:hypothetical protein
MCKEPTDSVTQFVNIKNDALCGKILSICQDIIFLKPKGRRIVPKHIVLGLTTCHQPGSTKLIDIVSGLGNCMSSKVITNYDNDIAWARDQQDRQPHFQGLDPLAPIYEDRVGSDYL